jgi:hypothetical protein
VKGLSFHDVADTFRRFWLPSAETIATAEWPQSLALDENPDNDGPRLHKGVW